MESTQPTLKAILFDMDDTLIDWSQCTSDWDISRQMHLENVLKYVIAEVQPIDTPATFYEVAAQLFEQAWLKSNEDGRSPHVGTILVRALETVGVPTERIDQKALLTAYNWGPVAGVVAFPDALETLPMICAAGIKTAIVTNSATPMWMRDIELKAYGMLDHFIDCRISAADVGYLKPHPAIFKVALDCLGVAAHEAIFVGDNPEADIMGAQSIGLRAVLRSIPTRTALVDAHIVPDGTIDTFHDLLTLLDDWYPGWRKAQPSNVVPSAAR